MKKSWIIISFFNFFIAALMGLMLRSAYIWEIDGLDYRNMMHGHSHLAMLGWVYLALYALIWYRFIPKEKRENQLYSRLFWFTQLTVVGMMVSFPIQGYQAISITFSSLHILSSYVFCYLVWKDHQIRKPEVRLLLKTALVLMVLSTMGVWILGPLAMSGGRNTAFYQVAIQFYLHFQFHGWFTFAVLALLIDALTKEISLNKKLFKRFYSLLLAATFLTYGLVLSWGYGGSLPLVINGFGLAFQLLALILFFYLIKGTDKKQFMESNALVRIACWFGLASWVLKVLLQSVVVVPEVAQIAVSIRSFMIGFIHLTMLGFISGLLLALLIAAGALKAKSRFLFAGLTAFITGFTLTELLLFVQGLFYWQGWGQLPFYHELLFGSSIFLPLGILFILFNLCTNGKYNHERQLYLMMT